MSHESQHTIIIILLAFKGSLSSCDLTSCNDHKIFDYAN